jgi:tripartite-type tricarboxylate transporter receptor subunit TctC
MPLNASAKRLLGYLLSLTMSVGVIQAAYSQIAGKPVTLIVPTSPATSTDIVARTLQPRLQKLWADTVIVENRTGASGAIGMADVVRADPDGNTVLISTSTMSMVNLTQKNLSWNPATDLQPVARLASLPYAIVVNPALPVHNVQELIALAKKSPGRLNYSTPGVGTPHHLVTEMFRHATGIDVMHIPYKTSAAAITDLVGGQVQFAFLPVQGVLPLVKAGKLRMIATVTDARTQWTLDVPTLKEQGVNGVAINSWIGAFLPKSASHALVDKYSRDMGTIVDSADVKAELLTAGIIVQFGGPGDMAALLSHDMALWRNVVTAGRVDLSQN